MYLTKGNKKAAKQLCSQEELKMKNEKSNNFQFSTFNFQLDKVLSPYRPIALSPLIVILIAISIFTSAYKKPEVFVIDAERNAYFHNNIGVTYMKEHCYYGAIQEFKIAISLSPNTQATAVYLKNLGDAYMEIGYPDYAQEPYEDAISQYGLNLLYYQKLAKCYKALGLIPSKIQEYSNTENPLDKVMLGVLYIENGDLKRGAIILDNFAMTEPDLLITPAVKEYLKEIIKKINS